MSLQKTLRATTFAVALALFCVGMFPRLACAGDEIHQKYNFNSDWLLMIGDQQGAEAPGFADSAWQKVTLPHAWNEDSAFKVEIADLPTGVAWYRKHFVVPQDSAGKKIFLEFEGIRQGGEFFLNGQSIGKSENGVMAFGFDITDNVLPYPAQNVIAARIDNAWDYKNSANNTPYQWNDRNFYANYGGINKNVFLHVTDKLHQTLPLYSNLGTTGVYVYAQDIDVAGKSATVTAEAQVRNEYTGPKTFSYEVMIKDLDGKVVQTIDGGQQTLAPGETKTVSASAKVPNLNFWSWGYGYLYDVTTALKVDGSVVDSVTTRTGFRKIEFTHGYLTLNGRPIQLKGYAQRTTNEWPAVGLSVPPWLSDFSNALMVAGNANFVRWMHVTPWKQDVESCDRVGLMMAMPAGDSEGDPKGKRWDFRVELMRDAIIYNRNNPSVVFYEGGNKGISEDHMTELKAVRDQYDPHGSRAIGAREMLDSKVAEYGGEMLYINKSATKPMWQAEYSRDEALRKYWDEFTPPNHKDGDGPVRKQGESPAPYNRNQDSFAVEEVNRWFEYWAARPGTGDRVNGGGVKIIFSDSNTHRRGGEPYRTSGAVDPMRIPKDDYFVQQVMWNGWVDLEHPGIYIVGHWNYDKGVHKPVYVVSSADKVELFVNGKSLGDGQQSSRFLYTWNDVAFEPGEIKAVGYDASGKQICETSKQTAGAPVALKLTPHTSPNGLRADGADMALVDVEVVDAQGNRCPTAMNMVTFDLKGPAEWRGGIGQGPDDYILSKQLPAECGINRVIIRSQTQPGDITLTATADGLKSAQVKLTSSAFSEKDGVSSTLPDSGMKPHLDRGPTPTGPSFTPTRKALHIVSATAGSNPDSVAMSYDDNEVTSWKSDDKKENAWIEYQLDHSATISQLVLKLGNFRAKAYPLRVSVDGAEVYSGVTPKSLGYVTLGLKPTTGQKVRIELTGDVENKDGFGLVEVSQKQGAEGKPAKESKSLEIIEAEIYAPINTP